jgi:phosphohistidine phosphatase SixA
MKRLIVMRHAKSSWKHAGMSDHQRPLNKRGRRDAPRVARALEERGWTPGRVLSSDSTRTKETWSRMERELSGTIPVEWLPSFYHAGAEAVLAELAALPDDEAGPVLVLGHNPSWEDLVRFLSGDPETLTTANAALLEAEGAWSALVTPACWRLLSVLRPRELGEESGS